MGNFMRATCLHAAYSGLLLLALAISVIQPASAASDTAPTEHQLTIHLASATDGDSLRAGDLRLRLYGIDAPEAKQFCTNQNGARYPCGKFATDYLAQLIRHSDVLDCHIKDIDRYRRLIVRCLSKGRDISQKIVQAGWAVAYRKYSKDYIAAETEARDTKQGVWQGRFEMPSDWRRKR